MTKSNRMLVAAPERWDEACFAVPAVRALAASGLEVGVLCGDGQADFWRTIGEIEVVVFNGKAGLEVWDAALAWEYGALAKAIRSAGVVRRVAPDGEKKLARWATDPVAVKVGVLEHRVRYFLATVEALGVATRDARFFAAAEVAGVAAGEAVLVCPDSDFGPSHEWPMERWAELARRLRDAHGLKIVVAAGRRGQALAEALGGEVPCLDASSPAAAMPGLAGYRLVVAADGSLAHLAAHVGATCVVLFGPNDASWRRPLGKRHAIVRRHVECAPCLMAKCPLDGRCQERLDVEMVEEAVRGCLAAH